MDSRLAMLALAGSVLASTVHAQGAVWIVDDDGGPGVDFTDLAAAVGAAADGDLLVFRDGTYPGGLFAPLTVTGKGLTLIADGDVELGWIAFEGLVEGQSAALRGFELTSSTFEASNNDGALFLEELSFDDSSSFNYSAADFTSCSTVILNRCSFQGAPAGVSPINTPAVVSALGGLHVYDCDLKGGAGFTHGGSFTPGNVALRVASGFAFSSGTALEAGILGTFGASQSGETSQSIVLDSPGAFDVTGGTQTVIPGTARSFQATAVAREGESITMTWEGVPGELAILNLSGSPGGVFFAPFNGSGVLGLPLLLVDGIGSIPAGGSLSVDIPVPELGAGVEGLVFYAQGSFADLGTGAIHLGGGSVIALLDQLL
ncbi:MAG: hypothetical protein AAF682_01860 [Planctomycetota bacterium]